MLRNEVTLCDIFENEIGVYPKTEAHQQGKLHRAFSVFLINDGKMLIQKRAASKYHTPNLWTNACCSHPRLHEDTVVSAELRCFEELGINVKLKELFTFTYYYEFKKDLIEYEYDHCLIGEYNGEFNLDPEEASECMWIEYSKLAAWVQEKPYEFTPWFLICLPKVLKMLENN